MLDGIVALPIETDEMMCVGTVVHRERSLGELATPYLEHLDRTIETLEDDGLAVPVRLLASRLPSLAGASGALSHRIVRALTRTASSRPSALTPSSVPFVFRGSASDEPAVPLPEFEGAARPAGLVDGHHVEVREKRHAWPRVVVARAPQRERRRAVTRPLECRRAPVTR